MLDMCTNKTKLQHTNPVLSIIFTKHLKLRNMDTSVQSMKLSTTWQPCNSISKKNVDSSNYMAALFTPTRTHFLSLVGNDK